MPNKFLVLKWDDIRSFGLAQQRISLQGIVNRIIEGRIKEGKKPDNSYIVINMDEPYVPEIVEIMKKHGHWEAQKRKE